MVGIRNNKIVEIKNDKTIIHMETLLPDIGEPYNILVEDNDKGEWEVDVFKMNERGEWEIV